MDKRTHLACGTIIVAVLVLLLPGSVWAGAGTDTSPTDQQIADAIEDELLFDRSISLNAVEVRVNDGIATLRGTVDNMLGQERAVRIAETVRGVRSVVDRIQVKPFWGRMAWEIEQDATTALIQDPATEPWEIDVTVDGNTATLTGVVDTWQEKHLAGEVVKGVRGVADLRNEITVDYDWRGDRSDGEIQGEIEGMLRDDVHVDDGLIAVSVTDGKVQLAGTVGSAAERRQAKYDAWVAGVTDVDVSGLAVKRWARDDDLRKDKYVVRTDEEVRKAIESALLYDPRVLSTNVTPEVTGGVVTLRGKVDNLKASRAAAQDARNTVGVATVVNRLKVHPASMPLDSIVQQNLESAIVRDPYLERYEIGVSVIDGTAYLSGSVDSYFEKGHADDLASRIDGVDRVRNNLTVDFDRPLAYDPYVDAYSPYGYAWYDYEPYHTFETDATIRKNIDDELWWSPFVDADEVRVTVTDGVARLEGTVDSWSERAAATENAYEGGAVWVDNDLRVATGG